ncbi:MAG: HAD-IIIA family hydrolase [Actinomycetota bacterium]|nr:HAD-IIIA family hydrolase [Actinomycetota bacterium]
MNATSGPPTQAVILAGGRGTRMRPLTDDRPKPMVEFHGRPFLEYLIEMLGEQGIERVELLLGYLPQVVQDHFGDGSRLGVDISYSVSGADDLTVSRLRLVQERLDPCFLLLYCDNYWPMDMERMWERFRALDVPAMVTVYANRDGHRAGKDSVLVDGDGYLRVFDKSRRTSGLQGVEISYAILDRDVLDLLPEEDAMFEIALYPQLAARGRLAAYVTDHRYYSVGSLERLAATERFLGRRPAVILDRDGTLNYRPPKAQYVTSPEQFDWLPGSLEALALLGEHGYTVAVVSNQAGIGRGAMTEGDLVAIHARMIAEARDAGCEIDAIYHCPHDWDEGCECRKPAPGMLFEAQRELDLDLSRTPFLGDDERDGQAAEAAGCPFVMVGQEHSLLDGVRGLVAERAVAA